MDGQSFIRREVQACWALVRAGRTAEAARRAAKHADQAGVGALWHVRGLAELLQGQDAEACEALDRAVRLEPGNASAWDMLGLALQRQQRHGEADRAFQRSLALAPEVASVWCNAAVSAHARRRFDEAVHRADRAIELEAGLGQAWLVRGNALFLLGHEAAAIESLQRAREYLGETPEVLAALGHVLARSGESARAIPLLRQLAREHPEFAPGRSNLADALLYHGQRDESFAEFRAALRLDRHCNDTWKAYLFALLHTAHLAPQQIVAAHLEYGEVMEAPWRARWGGWKNVVDPRRRLRVGFVSGDLRRHAVAFFIESVLEHLAGKGFELIAYHNHPREDDVSRRLRQHFVAWHPVFGLDDDALEARIRSDCIDILFDLSGHTDYNRLPVFARKPAPLQVSWIGYPGTTGLRAVDYRLVSIFGAPDERIDAQFVEKLVRLDASMPFRSGSDLPDLAPLPALTRGALTFANFSRAVKRTPETFDLWCAVLCALPATRMIIGPLDADEDRAAILAEFEARGVAPGRIDLRERMPLQTYLETHNEVDLILDAVPYGGGTTMNHALSMGVPTLALPGEMLAQRAAPARLRELGLEAFIARDAQHLVELACRWAEDLDQLATVRATLRQRLLQHASRPRGGLALERALRQMWQRWCSGNPPAPIRIDTSDTLRPDQPQSAPAERPSRRRSSPP